MAEQCYSLARRKWNAAYPKNKLVYDPVCGPELFDQAEDYGYRTYPDDAVAKSIACWDNGGYGHVAWVKRNNGNGTMDIVESNWPIGQGETSRTVTIGDRGATGSFTFLGCVRP